MGEGNNSPIEIDGIGLDKDLIAAIEKVSAKHWSYLVLLQLSREAKSIKGLLVEIRDLLKKE